MLEKFKEHIKEFPKLYEVYEQKNSEDYSLITMYIHSFDIGIDGGLTHINLEMKNKMEEIILISFMYIKEVLNEINVETISSQQKIHPGMALSRNLIENKQFKKRIFGGYDPDQVFRFKDLITKDYAFIEDGLIKENNRLKEEIRQLKEENSELIDTLK